MTVAKIKPASLVPLPPGHLACNACGVATPGSLPDPTKPRLRDIPEALCDKCRVTRAEANAIVASRPRLSGRYGSVVNERVAGLLRCYEVLGLDPEDRRKADLDVALTAYATVLSLLWWARSDRPEARLMKDPSANLCAEVRFGFLSAEDHAAIREARREEFVRKVSEFVDDAEIGSPSGSCLMCGTTQPVRVSAREVMSRGGIGSTQRDYWRRVAANAQALGNPKGCPRGTLVEGHLCPACTSAYEEVGSLGPRARERAVLAYVTKKMGPDAAARLDDMLDQKYGAPTLPAAPWEHPSGLPGPWAHLHGLLEVLRRPENQPV